MEKTRYWILENALKKCGMPTDRIREIVCTAYSCKNCPIKCYNTKGCNDRMEAFLNGEIKEEEEKYERNSEV